MRLRSASAAAAASPSRASWSWASSSSVWSWLSRPRRMNWPVTASSRHSSVAVMADWAAGWAVRPTAVASAMVISPGDGRGRDRRQPDRGDPDAHARRYLDRSVRLQDGQRHPAAADQHAHRGLRRRAAAGPADADRGHDRRGVHRERDEHPQAGAAQAGRGMSLGAGRHHDRDEQHAQRPQRLPLGVTSLAGARSRLGHPGRSGLVRPAGGRWRCSQARRGRPCLHGPSVARGGRRCQIRHGCLPGYGPRRPPGRPAAGRAGR